MAEATTSEAELLRRARSGEVEAFGQLVEHYQDYVYNVVFHLVGSDREAEDIAQEVFMRAYTHLDRFQGRARFSTWLYGIALNCARTMWRKRGRRGRVVMSQADGDADMPLPAANADGPEDELLRQERVAQVRAAIAALDGEMREAIVLRDIQGLAYEEMAEVLGVALGTVKSRLHRARQALRDILGPFFDTV